MSTTHVLKVEEPFHRSRLDIFLTKNLPDAISRTFVKKLIDGGHVQVNGKQVKVHYKVSIGEEVHVEITDELLPDDSILPENIPLDIFYEDEYLLIVNKPSGLLVHPATGIYSGTLVNALLHHSKQLSDLNTEMRPGIVHRLDQETSGLMVVAKNNKVHKHLADQFQEHTVFKRYVALVKGEVAFEEGKIDVPIGRDPFHRERKTVSFDNDARESLTFYKVIKHHKGISLLALYPKTGRTHQLRVHLKHINHPILGDVKYGHKTDFPRLALHAQAIGFQHPGKKGYVEFWSKPPAEFLKKVAIDL